MNPNDAFELIRTLGSLASIVSTYWSIRQTGRIPDERLKNLLLYLPKTGPRERLIDLDDIEFVQALPKEIGDAANKRIQRALERYRRAIESQMNFLELDREADIAAEEICNFLRLIKKHHGELPTKNWRDLWKQFKCDEVD